MNRKRKYIDIHMYFYNLLAKFTWHFSRLKVEIDMMTSRTRFSHHTILGVISAGLFFSFLSDQPAFADYESGLEAFNRGAHEEALPLFEDAATLGDPRAQYFVGKIFGEGLGTSRDLSEAAYWLNCAGASDHSISMSARRLKARLLRSLSAQERATASNASMRCPAPALKGETGLSFALFASNKTYSETHAEEGGFTGFMEGLRSNGAVSLFLLPGDVTIALARETASLSGAKQTAYAIDSARLPGNDILYLMVVFFSWFLLYKLVMGANSVWQKFSEVAFTIEIRKEGRQTLSSKNPDRHGNLVGAA